LATRSDLLAALLRSPAATAILRGDLDGIAALGLSRDAGCWPFGDGDGTMAIHDLRTHNLLQEKFQGHNQVIDLEFSPTDPCSPSPPPDSPSRVWVIGMAALLVVVSSAVQHLPPPVPRSQPSPCLGAG
jgi:hypothetical protein